MKKSQLKQLIREVMKQIKLKDLVREDFTGAIAHNLNNVKINEILKDKKVVGVQYNDDDLILLTLEDGTKLTIQSNAISGEQSWLEIKTSQ